MHSSRYRSDTRTVNMFRCRMSLGNDRYVEVKEWKGELRVDLREWKDDKPTKKGISLTLMRWKNWVDSLECADQTRAEKKPYMGHLGGNVYCTVTEDSSCMDIRQFWMPKDELVPTKKGLCFRPIEYSALKELVPQIGIGQSCTLLHAE